MTGEDYERFGVPPSGVVAEEAFDADRPPEFADASAVLGHDLDEVELDESLLRSDRPWGGVFAWLTGPTAMALAVLAGAGIVLIVLHHVLAVLANIAQLPVWGQWLTYGLLGVLLVAIGLAAGRVAFAFVRLRSTPRVSSKALRALAERAALREAATSDLDRARRALRRILDEHPVADAKSHSRLLRAGFKADEIDAIAADRLVLLTEYAENPPSVWIERYRTLFARPLDKVATRAIRRRSLLVGAKTAALPNGGLDTAVALAHAFLLVGDLCTIYNLRTNRQGVAALTWRVLLGAFIAGRLEDITDQAAQHLSDAAGGAAAGVFAKTGSAIAGKLVGKAAEGMVNAAFCYRLGVAAMKRLRPID